MAAQGVFRPDAAPTPKAPFSLSSIAVSPDTVGQTVTHRGRSDRLSKSDAQSWQPGVRGVSRFEFEKVPLAQLIWRQVRDWALLTLWLLPQRLFYGQHKPTNKKQPATPVQRTATNGAGCLLRPTLPARALIPQT